MSRIEPLEPPYAEETGSLLARMMPGGAAPIGLFRLFVKNLPMATAMHGWGGYELSKELSLNLREREIVIDRTTARCGCEYEWGVHLAVFAGRAGLTTEQQISLTHGEPDDPCWTVESERLLIRAVDSLHGEGDIDDGLWGALAKEFDERQLLDLVLLCGWYHAISFVARVTRLPNEPGTPNFADLAATTE